MTQQGSLTTFLTTTLGASLCGIWRLFRKQTLAPVEAVGCQTATPQPSPSLRLPSPEQLLAVKPVVVSSGEQWDLLWPSLRRELSLFPALGLDCEWVSVNGRESAVSLLQIASYSGLCILVRLVAFRGGQQSIPLSLIEVLHDPHILKVGVDCYEDGKRLARDYGLSLRCAVDLRNLALRQGQVALNNVSSLQSLAANVLSVSLDKSPKLRCSDWEADQLTSEQITYAARDSQVSIALFFHLLGEAEATPATTGCIGYPQLAARCRGLIDVSFRRRIVDGEENIADVQRRQRLRKPPCDSPESGDQQVPDPLRNSARKSALYDNCFLHAPDGRPLWACSKKTAMRYLSKGLGELQSEDPFIIVRLLSEPSHGRHDSYFLTVKENLCVVCGEADFRKHIEKHIVPLEYRRHFPNEMKDSYDLLLLCTVCHAASEVHDHVLKQQLAKECGTPSRHVRSAARILLSTSRHPLPDKRRKELEAVVRSFCCDVESEAEGVQNDALNAPLSPHALHEAAYTVHGLKVVRAYAEKGLRGLLELERQWRQHFITYMKPHYLPLLWSVDHKHFDHSKLLLKYGEDLPIQLHCSLPKSRKAKRKSKTKPKGIVHPCPSSALEHFT